MKLSHLSMVALLSLLNMTAFAKTPGKEMNKVIYGKDDRLDIYESSDSLMREIALSTAAQILNRNLVQEGELFSIKAKTLGDGGACKTERFSTQIAAANCSAFLIAPDKLVTAGHCINSVSECEQHSWVFDFANNEEEKSSFSFDKSQVYRCTGIIERQKDVRTLSDYAVIKLDRPVFGRAPLKFRTSGKPANDAVLTIIGHPSGLPTKITAAADMRDNSHPLYFVTNADTFGGNSGSAVVDSRTGIVEGILVRGDQDYTRSTDGCMVAVQRGQNEGRGEDITRITIIKALKR